MPTKQIKGLCFGCASPVVYKQWCGHNVALDAGKDTAHICKKVRRLGRDEAAALGMNLHSRYGETSGPGPGCGAEPGPVRDGSLASRRGVPAKLGARSPGTYTRQVRPSTRK